MSAYWAGFTRGFLRTVATPGALATRVGFFAIILLVLSALWHAALETHPDGVAGYDLTALMWYVFAAQAAVLGVRPRTVEDIGEEIGSGSIAIAMLRPVSVVGMRMAIDSGEGAARLAAGLVVGVPMTWLLAGPPRSAAGLVLAVPSAAIAMLANIASQHAFGGVAFWLRDSKSAWLLHQKVVFLAGGMLIPLEMMPNGVASVCRVLPFAAMAYAPGRLASGHIEPGLLTGQVAWALMLIGAAIVIFARGQRRLQVAGG